MSTHSPDIWYDLGGYDPLEDGPPYLKTASSAVPLVGRLMAAHQGQDYWELGVLIAALKANSTLHQSHHWQTRGGHAYSDHLLFERAYTTIDGLVDGLGEHAVGLGHVSLGDPKVLAFCTHAWVECFYQGVSGVPDAEALPALSLCAVNYLKWMLKLTRARLSNAGQLEDGLDNALQGASDEVDTLQYLLQQRCGGKSSQTPKGLAPAETWKAHG